jgi:hypothetical protein
MKGEVMSDGPTCCCWGAAGISDASGASAALRESRIPGTAFRLCVFVGGILGHPSQYVFEVGTMVDEHNDLPNLGNSAPRLTAVSGGAGELRKGRTRV